MATGTNDAKGKAKGKKPTAVDAPLTIRVIMTPDDIFAAGAEKARQDRPFLEGAELRPLRRTVSQKQGEILVFELGPK